MFRIILGSLFLVVGALAATPRSCRFKAAEVVVQDLNRNGRLWEARQQRSGEVQIFVEGKIWLELADEELSQCEDDSSLWGSEAICVDYKFHDPETFRVEHQVQMQLAKNGCIFRSYRNIVGSRPWR